MTIHLSACSKGGVGKTSVSVNLAARLATLGRRVCLVDTDKKQHNSAAWALTRQEAAPSLPRIEHRVMTGPIAVAIQKLATEFDDLIVDAGGHDSLEMRAAMRVSDIIIMPFAASTFDLWSLETMEELLDGARAFNENLRALGFVNKAASQKNRQRPIEEAREFMRGFGASLHTADTIVRLRESPFSTSAKVGRSVYEIGRSGRKAADDLEDLIGQAQQVLRMPAQKGPNHGVHTSA